MVDAFIVGKENVPLINVFVHLLIPAHYAANKTKHTISSRKTHSLPAVLHSIQ